MIAGVAADSLSESFGEPPTPAIYLSYRDRPSARGEIHVRTRAGAESLLAPAVERLVRELDPALPVYDVSTLTDHVEKNLVLRRIPARMFVVLGPMLLVLAAMGIYAVVAYTVSRRTAEIGIRLALSPAVHTWIMRFAIDVVFADRDGRVLKVYETLKPYRSAAAYGAFVAVEIAAGRAAAAVAVGDQLVLSPAL